MQADGGKSSSAYGVLLGMAVIALTGTIGTIGLLREVGELGPKVGDIVSFDPAEPFPNDLTARIAAAAADSRAGVSCVLDVRTMHAGGGSVVIEARQPKAQVGYRVHWAGNRSSDDGTDCGASADLLLTQEDIQILAMAAGGYGVAARKQAGSPLLGSTQ